MTDHFEQTAAGMMIFLMNLQMLGKLVDTGGQNCNLNLRRTGVFVMKTIVLDDSRVLFFS